MIEAMSDGPPRPAERPWSRPASPPRPARVAGKPQRLALTSTVLASGAPLIGSTVVVAPGWRAAPLAVRVVECLLGSWARLRGRASRSRESRCRRCPGGAPGRGGYSRSSELDLPVVLSDLIAAGTPSPAGYPGRPRTGRWRPTSWTVIMTHFFTVKRRGDVVASNGRTPDRLCG